MKVKRLKPVNQKYLFLLALYGLGLFIRPWFIIHNAAIMGNLYLVYGLKLLISVYIGLENTPISKLYLNPLISLNLISLGLIETYFVSLTTPYGLLISTTILNIGAIIQQFVYNFSKYITSKKAKFINILYFFVAVVIGLVLITINEIMCNSGHIKHKGVFYILSNHNLMKKHIQNIYESFLTVIINEFMPLSMYIYLQITKGIIVASLDNVKLRQYNVGSKIVIDAIDAFLKLLIGFYIVYSSKSSQVDVMFKDLTDFLSYIIDLDRLIKMYYIKFAITIIWGFILSIPICIIEKYLIAPFLEICDKSTNYEINTLAQFYRLYLPIRNPAVLNNYNNLQIYKEQAKFLLIDVFVWLYSSFVDYTSLTIV